MQRHKGITNAVQGNFLDDAGGERRMLLKAVFLLVAFGAIVGAIGMLVAPKPVHSALFLVLSLLCVAVVYLLLGAEFLAFVQIIVYAGAIMVLFLFIIMLLDLRRDEFGPETMPAQWTWGLIFTALLAIALVSIAGAAVTLKFSGDPLALTPISELARSLFTKYLLAFEIASLILLIAMVGVIVLAKRPKGGA